MKKLKQNEGRSFYLKKILRFFMWVAIVLIGLLAAVFLAFPLSPRPGALSKKFAECDCQTGLDVSIGLST